MARALSHMFKEKEENKTRESFKSINPLILEELSKGINIHHLIKFYN